MMDPRNLNDSTVATVLSMMVSGESAVFFYYLCFVLSLSFCAVEASVTKINSSFV